MESLSLNDKLLIWINQDWANPVFDAFFTWLSMKAGFSVPLLVAIVIYIAWKYKANGWLLGLLILLTTGISDLIGNTLKDIFLQPRPCLELHDYIRSAWDGSTFCASSTSGMPSNHAMNFFATFSFICFFFPNQRVIITSIALAGLVSLSRIYLGEHYPSQVAVGMIFGLILGFCLAIGCQKLFRQQLKFNEN